MTGHKLKIVRKANETNGFMILNEKGVWSSIPNSSQLSRPEYTNMDLCNKDNAKQVINYIDEIYNAQKDLEIVLEGCEPCLDSIRSAVEEKIDSNLCLRQDSQGILVIGKTGSGITILFDALIGCDTPHTENKGYITRRSGAYRWNELKGLGVGDSLESILQMIDNVIKEEDISTIIYCINSTNSVEDTETAILDSISETYGLRTAVVITNSIDDGKANKIRDDIAKYSNRSFVVLAQPHETNKGILEQFGIKELEDYIYEGL